MENRLYRTFHSSTTVTKKSSGWLFDILKSYSYQKLTFWKLTMECTMKFEHMHMTENFYNTY